MTTADISTLADSWIAYWLQPESSPEQEALSWVTDQEYELVRNCPDEAWFLILEILRRNNSSQIVELLAAGPLEDLLAHHGERMIASVETEAKGNPEFARLLGGVWKNAMSEEVWSRVQTVWNRRGWDGNQDV